MPLWNDNKKDDQEDDRKDLQKSKTDAEPEFKSESVSNRDADIDPNVDLNTVIEEKSKLPQLESWETLLFSTTPHPKSFLRLWGAWGVLTSLWVVILILQIYNIPINNRLYWWSFIATTVILAGVVYTQSRGFLGKTKVMVYFCNFWVISFIVVLSILLMKMIHTELTATSNQWWERFLGLPFSISSIVFSILVFIVSRVVWRIGYLVPKPYSFPLYAMSISLVVVSLYSLVLASSFDIISSSEILQYMFMLFSLLSIAYSMFLVSFINHKGGIKYLMTTRRIVISSDFMKHSVEDHMFDKVHDIMLDQSYFGRKYDYGDLRIMLLIILETRKGERIHRQTFNLNGVPKPLLMKNALMAFISAGLSKKKAPQPVISPSPNIQDYTQSIPQVIVTQEFVMLPQSGPESAITIMRPTSDSTKVLIPPEREPVPTKKDNVETTAKIETVPPVSKKKTRSDSEHAPTSALGKKSGRNTPQNIDDSEIEEFERTYEKETKKSRK